MVGVAKCYTSGVSRPKSLTQNATQCSKMLRSKRGLKKYHSVFPEENTQKNIFPIGTEDALYIDMENKVSQKGLKMKKVATRVVVLTTLTKVLVHGHTVIAVQTGKIVSNNPTDIQNAQIAYDESR